MEWRRVSVSLEVGYAMHGPPGPPCRVGLVLTLSAIRFNSQSDFCRKDPLFIEWVTYNYIYIIYICMHDRGLDV